MIETMRIKAFKKDGTIKYFNVQNPLQVSIIDFTYEKWEYIL